MTENIPQTSSSERVEKARKALAEWDNLNPGDSYDEIEESGHGLAEALRALITPPPVGESVERIASQIMLQWDTKQPASKTIEKAVRAGIQSAFETWEPEVALRPSQEQMLRWLGIDHEASRDFIVILGGIIDREEI